MQTTLTAAQALQASQASQPQHLTAITIVRLMRKHSRSIAGTSMQVPGLTQVRVRQVRSQGVKGWVNACCWLEIITGDSRVWDDPAISWNILSKAYA